MKLVAISNAFLKHSGVNVCKAGFLFQEKKILIKPCSLLDQDVNVTHKELLKAPSTQYKN